MGRSSHIAERLQKILQKRMLYVYLFNLLCQVEMDSGSREGCPNVIIVGVLLALTVPSGLPSSVFCF
jgi:hypothetical protein